mmetsp:Transcript_44345/g.71044  ORF Transcript_44345/g.71044 Transcript_44345/m.71044 type:complete len:215 (-) Transcript_44345:7-651(-)
MFGVRFVDGIAAIRRLHAKQNRLAFVHVAQFLLAPIVVVVVMDTAVELLSFVGTERLQQIGQDAEHRFESDNLANIHDRVRELPSKSGGIFLFVAVQILVLHGQFGRVDDVGNNGRYQSLWLARNVRLRPIWPWPRKFVVGFANIWVFTPELFGHADERIEELVPKCANISRHFGLWMTRTVQDDIDELLRLLVSRRVDDPIDVVFGGVDEQTS